MSLDKCTARHRCASSKEAQCSQLNGHHGKHLCQGCLTFFSDAEAVAGGQPQQRSAASEAGAVQTSRAPEAHADHHQLPKWADPVTAPPPTGVFKALCDAIEGTWRYEMTVESWILETELVLDNWYYSRIATCKEHGIRVEDAGEYALYSRFELGRTTCDGYLLLDRIMLEGRRLRGPITGEYAPQNEPYKTLYNTQYRYVIVDENRIMLIDNGTVFEDGNFKSPDEPAREIKTLALRIGSDGDTRES